MCRSIDVLIAQSVWFYDENVSTSGIAVSLIISHQEDVKRSTLILLYLAITCGILQGLMLGPVPIIGSYINHLQHNFILDKLGDWCLNNCLLLNPDRRGVIRNFKKHLLTGQMGKQVMPTRLREFNYCFPVQWPSRFHTDAV